MRKQRVLIIDDSPFIRRILGDWIGAESDMEVVGYGKDGSEGIEAAQRLKPDIVTLDVEMPVMSGLDALPDILSTGANVLMVSSVTVAGAALTMRALEAGAYDFVTKPNHGSSLEFVHVKQQLLDRVRAAHYVKRVASADRKPVRAGGGFTCDKVVVIASSTGGPSALKAIWDSLPKDFPAPILVAQHMPPGFTASLAARLSHAESVPCDEAVAGVSIKPGRAYLAPGDRHLTIDSQGKLRLDEREKIHGVRPAADYLFESAAESFGPRCIGVVLTGMGKDGAQGAVAIREAGGHVLAQDEATSVIFGMPKAAQAAGGVDAMFPLNQMATAIVSSLRGKVQRAS